MTADNNHIRITRPFNDEELDRLLRLVVESAEHRNDAPASGHAAYLEWLAARLRDFSDPADRLVAERISGSVLSRLAVRLKAAQLGVRVYQGSPPLDHAPAAESLADALAAASQRGFAPWMDLAIAPRRAEHLWKAQCEWWLEVPAEIPAGVYTAFALRAPAGVPEFVHDGDTILVDFKRPLEPGVFVLVWLRDRRYMLGELVSAVGTSLTVRPPDSARQVSEVMCRNPDRAGRVVARWCPHQRASASP